MELLILNLDKTHNDSLGRICIDSAYTFKTLTYSWLKLDIENYLGQAITLSKFSKKIYYFYCQKYKHIYLYEKDLNYIYDSALKHEDYKTAALVKLAIDDVREWED